jgi:hypothetical protein
VDEPSKASPACLVARNDLIPSDELLKATRRSSWARSVAGNHRSTKSRVGHQSSYAPVARSDSPMGVGLPPQFDHAGPSDEAPSALPAFPAVARFDVRTRPVRRNTGCRLGAARGQRLGCDRQLELNVGAYEWNKHTRIISINDILRKCLMGPRTRMCSAPRDPLITAAQAASAIFDAGGGSVPRILSNSGRFSGAGGSGARRTR